MRACDRDSLSFTSVAAAAGTDLVVLCVCCSSCYIRYRDNIKANILKNLDNNDFKKIGVLLSRNPYQAILLLEDEFLFVLRNFDIFEFV